MSAMGCVLFFFLLLPSSQTSLLIQSREQQGWADGLGRQRRVQPEGLSKFSRRHQQLFKLLDSQGNKLWLRSSGDPE